MELKVLRYGHSEDSTGGLLFVNGSHFCYTCEDEYREIKILGETRIPSGRYEIKLRDAGSMNEKYKIRYPFHIGMLHLQNVPGFEWIYIHTGNTEAHTEGCILVGRSGAKVGDNYSVGSSVDTYKELYQLIIAALKQSEQIYVTIEDL